MSKLQAKKANIKVSKIVHSKKQMSKLQVKKGKCQSFQNRAFSEANVKTSSKKENVKVPKIVRSAKQMSML
jgi:hypothetical protein